MSKDVTICSVITPSHAKLMEINYKLISRLNADGSINWIITYNHEVFVPGSTKEIRVTWKKQNEVAYNVINHMKKIPESSEQIRKLLKEFPEHSIVDGMTLEQAFDLALENTDKTRLKRLDYEVRALKYLPSYHHAFGLELAASKAKTRFLVLIDPDFYVIQADWISLVVDYMKKQKLAVFGAPWNPRWYQKFRVFPCSHLMVIDRERLRLSDGTLLPELISRKPTFASTFWRDIAKEWNKTRSLRWRSLFRYPLQALKEDWLQRRSVGMSQDTGFKVRHRCQQQQLAFDSLTPVFDPDLDGFEPPGVTPIQVHPLLQCLLPENKVYLPKNPMSYSRAGFKEQGLPSFRGIGWEEFLWGEKAFAFHVRGQRRGDLSRDLLYLRSGLETIFGRRGLGPLADVSPEEVPYALPVGLIKSPKGLVPS